MAASEDIVTWATGQKLPTEVTEVLKDNGFKTTDDITVLTPTDIKEVFQDSGLLNVAQCLALKKAVIALTQAHSPSASSPFPPPQPPPPSAPAWTTSQLNGFQSDPCPSQPHRYPPQSYTYAAQSQPNPQIYPPQPHPYHPEPQSYPPQPHPYHPQPHTPQSHLYPSIPGLQAASYLTQGQQMSSHAQPYIHSQTVPVSALPGQSVPSAVSSAWSGDPGMMQGACVGVGGCPAGGSECFRFLLLGKTGSGKSTTGNTIFGERLFDTAATFASVTAECERKTNKRNGRKIEIIDSPGLYDTHKSQEEICVLIVQAVAGMHPGPHAILYVVRLGRYTAEEHGAYQRLKALFDDTIRRYLIVVFTYGDMLERDQKTIADLIGPDTPETLRQVLNECNNRYIVFNNMASDPRPQVEQLLQMVRQMVAENGGQPYSCPKYGNIGEGMEQEVARRLQEVEKRDLQRQKYVQQLEQHTKEAEESVRRTQEQFQKNEEERQRRMQEEEERRRQLEEQLQDQMKQQQIGFEHYQQELQLLHQQQEAQERMMKEKEAEMTERERKRAEEEAERMRQREQEMQAMMKEQEERVRRQRQEDEERRQQVERERQEFMQQMEEQRRKDREELERREEERERLREQQREEERETARIREENYEKEMERLKSQVVAKEATDFVKTFLTAVTGVVRLLTEIERTETERERIERAREDPFFRMAPVTYHHLGARGMMDQGARLGGRDLFAVPDDDDDN